MKSDCFRYGYTRRKNDVKLSAGFEDKSMLDNAYNKIFTSYGSGNPGCDITEYVKKGTVV